MSNAMAESGSNHSANATRSERTAKASACNATCSDSDANSTDCHCPARARDCACGGNQLRMVDGSEDDLLLLPRLDYLLLDDAVLSLHLDDGSPDNRDGLLNAAWSLGHGIGDGVCLCYGSIHHCGDSSKDGIDAAYSGDYFGGHKTGFDAGLGNDITAGDDISLSNKGILKASIEACNGDDLRLLEEGGAENILAIDDLC